MYLDHKESFYLPENGILNSNSTITKQLYLTSKDDIINILWIGRIDASKSLNILLEALANISNYNWLLHVIGDGEKKLRMKNLAEKLNIDKKIKWYGQVPRSEVMKLIQLGHLHVITSLGEGNPTTIWETLANGIPTITLDHCGMKDTICEKCGVKIPIVSYEQVIQDLSVHLKKLIEEPDKIRDLSFGAISCSKNYTWEKRTDFFNNAYDVAIFNYLKRNK